MTESASFPSPNYTERRGGLRPSLVVIHYTAMQSCAEARARLCDPNVEVSAHWLISEAGEVEALVPEEMRAWHAGAGSWAGREDVNSQSIGIELANPSTHPYPEPQMAALETLLKGILDRWQIPAHRVIGHSDMAPGRKSDPGSRFDWQRLAKQGLSVWPDPKAPLADRSTFRDSALSFGYPDVADDLLLAAFRLRFRPWAQGSLSAKDATVVADLAARFPAALTNR